MMTRRTRFMLFIAIAILLILILLWLLFVLFWRDRSSDAQPITTVEQTTSFPETEPTPARVEQEKEERKQGSDIIALAKTFVERYGSYSNEAEFANVEDVLVLMSDVFADQTQQIVAEADQPFGYYGVSTQVITVQVELLDETQGLAEVLVNTQRAESQDSPQNVTVRYQEIRLRFIQEADVWKVDSAVWL